MQEGKKFKNVAGSSFEHIAKFKKPKTIECSFVKAMKVHHPRYAYVFTIHTPGSIAKNQRYEVTIGDFPACSCFDFVTMKTSALGHGQNEWILCKHLYFCLYKFIKCTVGDKFIHRPAWTFNEVRMLSDKADWSRYT